MNRSFLTRGGETRKFYRNMRENRSARLVGISLLPMLGPVALLVLAAFALFFGPELFQHAQAATIHGHGSMLAAGVPLVSIREMREKRGKIADDMAKLVPVSGVMSKEDRDKFNAMDADQEALKGQIEAAERANALEAETRTGPPRDSVGGADAEAAKVKLAKRKAAFSHFLRVGTGSEDAQRMGLRPLSSEERTILQELFSRDVTPAELRDLGTGGGNALQGAGAGYFVEVGFEDKIEEALKYFGGMLQTSTILDTATGGPLPFPTDNDTTNMGEIVGEGQQVSTQDVSVASILFGAYKFSTKMVRVSIELLQDSAFDIDSYLAKKFATRLGRVWNNKFTVGSGTSEPKGIVTAASVGVSSATNPAIVGDDNSASPDPTTQFGFIDLVNLEHSVDVSYRNGAKWMMNDTSVRYAKTLKDKYGRPLWMPGMVANQPDSINGYPFVINNDMAGIATGNIVVLFGQLEKYMVRRVKQLSIVRLSERFIDYGQVAFLGFARADGNLLDAGTHPVRYLKLT
ncbi:MAG: phage major capsid protein [Terriglobales bacterium]